MATLVEQRAELKHELKAYRVMLDEALTYLHSDKFNKFQDSSPNELCDKVQVDDIIRRLDIHHYLETRNFIE